MKKKEQIIYEFLYCECIHESSYASLSLHKTKEGAEKAMKKHKSQKLREFNKRFKSFYSKQPKVIRDSVKFGQHEDWQIGQQILLD